MLLWYLGIGCASVRIDCELNPIGLTRIFLLILSYLIFTDSEFATPTDKLGFEIKVISSPLESLWNVETPILVLIFLTSPVTWSYCVLKLYR